MSESIDLSDDEAEQHICEMHLAVLNVHYPSLEGVRIFEVGCGSASFILACKAKGAEMWGADHNEYMLSKATEVGGLTAEDMARVFLMPFSEIIDQHSELIGSFDVVRIAGVAAYMQSSPREIRSTALNAHALLKPSGILLFEPPLSLAPAGNVFQAGQGEMEVTQNLAVWGLANAAIMESPNPQSAIKEMKKYQDVFKRTLNAFFEGVEESGRMLWLCHSPRERGSVPQLDDICVNLAQMTVNIKGHNAPSKPAPKDLKPKNTSEPRSSS